MWSCRRRHFRIWHDRREETGDGVSHHDGNLHAWKGKKAFIRKSGMRPCVGKKAGKETPKITCRGGGEESGCVFNGRSGNVSSAPTFVTGGNHIETACRDLSVIKRVILIFILPNVFLSLQMYCFPDSMKNPSHHDERVRMTTRRGERT